MNETILLTKNLSRSFGGIKAVDRLNIELYKGEIVGLIGPNGSGKTTLFDLISGFYDADGGRVMFGGEDITQLSPHKIARLGIGRTFQLLRLFPKMTVLENLLVAEKVLQGEKFWKALVKMPDVEKEDKANVEKAHRLLEFVELKEKEEHLAVNLSYGQQKLLEIARALALEPKLLLLDEPAAGLNPVIKKKVFDVIGKLHKQGKTVCIVEHDMETVMGLCERVIVLDAGQKIAEGTPKEIQKNKKVLEAYLGHPKKGVVL